MRRLRPKLAGLTDDVLAAGRNTGQLGFHPGRAVENRRAAMGVAKEPFTNNK